MSTKKECLEKINDAIQKRLALWKWPGGHVTPESTLELAAFLKEAGVRALEKIGTSLCNVCGKQPSCLNTEVATAEIKGAWHSVPIAYDGPFRLNTINSTPIQETWRLVPSRIHMLRYKHCSHVNMYIINKGNQVAKANAVAVEEAKREAFQQRQRQILEKAKATAELADLFT